MDGVNDLQTLQAHIDRDDADLRAQPGWPGGWPHDIEAALIDAVFSIRARYGSETSGVRGVVQRWRTHRGGERIDDLAELAAVPTETLANVLDNASKTHGILKSEAVRQAAVVLSAAGIRSSADVSTANREVAKEAYTSVHGLGWVTASYFLMLLGLPSFKADTHVCAYVGDAIGRPGRVSAQEAYSLLASVRSSFTSTELDHAIWNLQKSRSGS